MIYCLLQYILGERECFSTYQTVTTACSKRASLFTTLYMYNFTPMSSHKLLRRPYSCSGVFARVTLAPPTRPPGVAPSVRESRELICVAIFI